MDSTASKMKGGMLTALFFVMESLNHFLRVASHVFSLRFLALHNPTAESPTEEYENGARRRKSSDISSLVVPNVVMPHNLFNILSQGRDLSGNGPCVGFRTSTKDKYRWVTYQELIERATNFGAGLVTLGGKTDCEYLVGIFARTCVEWTVAEYGCFAYGMATAPLYDSLGAEACQETVSLYGIEIMICGADEQVAVLLDEGKFPSKLRTIITIDQLKPERIAQLEKLGVKVVKHSEVEELGARNRRPLCLAPSDSLASLIFTSGTTGAPKGAMLTHGHFTRTLSCFMESIYPLRLTTDDALIAVFPLSHVFERMIEKVIHVSGGKVGYLTNDIKDMMKDAQAVRPTFFVFVPRLMNRLYDQIQADLQKSFLGRTAGKMGLAAKLRDMKNGIFSKDTVWDSLVFKKYQAMLGGRIRGSMTGSAAIEGKVLNFIRAVFGCYVFEIYGQTEASGPIACTSYGDITTGHVGIPCVDVEVKLVDVPEMGYYAKNHCGEICSRSPFTMNGYYKMPEKTAETLDEDGWLHTGDIGMWTEDGKLKIFDRKKHIFKLSQGEYLAPERLEGVYGRSSLMTNVFVDGDSKFPFPVALVYPNYDAFNVSPTQTTQVKYDGRETSHKTYIREKIMEEFGRLAKDGKLKSYEIPKKVTILEEPFSVANNCLTPSQKTKRDVVRVLHRESLRKMYESE